MGGEGGEEGCDDSVGSVVVGVRRVRAFLWFGRFNWPESLGRWRCSGVLDTPDHVCWVPWVLTICWSWLVDQVSIDFAVDVDEGMQRQSDRRDVFLHHQESRPRFEVVSDLLCVGIASLSVPFLILCVDADLARLTRTSVSAQRKSISHAPIGWWRPSLMALAV